MEPSTLKIENSEKEKIYMNDKVVFIPQRVKIALTIIIIIKQIFI